MKRQPGSKRILVLDTSTIIVVVYELNRPHLIEQLQEHGITVAIPQAVKRELERAGRSLHLDAETIAPSGQPPPLPGLGEGEREAIQVALELEGRGYHVILVTDDQKARKRARELGIKVTGTLGLIEIAKKTGVITKTEAIHILENEIPQTSLYTTREILEQATTKIREQKQENQAAPQKQAPNTPHDPTRLEVGKLLETPSAKSIPSRFLLLRSLPPPATLQYR